MKALLSVSATLMLLGLFRGAYAGSVTVQAMNQEVATNRAIGKVPKGKKCPTLHAYRFRWVCLAIPLIAVQLPGNNEETISEVH